jgi:hypothetical protein
MSTISESFEDTCVENSSTANVFHVPLLNQYNYPEWTPKIVTHLKSKGLYIWISGVAMEQIEDFDKLPWEDKLKVTSFKEKAFGEIEKHIDPSLHELFVDIKDPVKLWNFLRDHFQGQESFTQIELILLLVRCKLNEGKSIAEYVSKKTQLHRRLGEAGIKIPDMLFCAFLLCGLPKSLDVCRRIMESRQNLNSAEIIKSLHKEEQRMKVENLAWSQDDDLESKGSKRMRTSGEEAFPAVASSGCKGHPDACGKMNHNWTTCYYNVKSENFNKWRYVQREIQRMEEKKRDQRNPSRKGYSESQSSQQADGKH